MKELCSFLTSNDLALSQEQYPDINGPLDVLNNTLLHLAVAQQDLTLVSFLVAKGAHINVVNHSGTTPYRIAQLLQLDTIATLLKKHGAMEDYLSRLSRDELESAATTTLSPSSSGISPMSSTLASPISTRSRSSSSGRAVPFQAPILTGDHISNAAGLLSKSGFEKLLAAGSNCRHIDTGDEHQATALMKAAFRRRPDAVEALLRAGGFLAYRDDQQLDALFWGCLGGDKHVVQALLLQMRRSRDNILENCLQAAVYSGNLEIVTLLLQSRTFSMETAQSALVLACWMGWKPIVQLFASRGLKAESDVKCWLWTGVARLEGIERLKRNSASAGSPLQQEGLSKRSHTLPASSLSPEASSSAPPPEQNVKRSATLATPSSQPEKRAPAGFHKLPNGKSPASLADDMFQFIHDAFGIPMNATGENASLNVLQLALESQEEKNLESLKNLWGSRLASNKAWMAHDGKLHERFRSELLQNIQLKVYPYKARA